MIRVLVVGAAPVAVALRDAGFEVVYLAGATPGQAASVALQEDVDGVVLDGEIGDIDDVPVHVGSDPDEALRWAAALDR